MAYFERIGLKDTTNTQINPAQEESLTLLRRIFQLLRPLGFITGSGSNRINLDVNNVTTLPSLSTNTLGTVTNITNLPTLANVTTVSNVTNLPTLANVTTVAGVTGVTNVTNLATSTIGPSPTFEFLKAISRSAYNSGIRANIN